MGETSIQWTDAVWNPTRGCSRVSPGCGGGTPHLDGKGGCYAERMAYRFGGPGLPYEGLVALGKSGPRWTGKVPLLPSMLEVPLRWRKPRRIFVNSMSDLFHEALSNEQIAAVFGVMAACPQHTFQVLTKRAERMAAWFNWLAKDTADENGPSASEACCIHACNHGAEIDYERRPWPLPNVHLGVSVESQQYADQRIPYLLLCPAEVHWVSAEPLLGPLELKKWIKAGTHCDCPPGHRNQRCDGVWVRCNVGLRRLRWIVVGGESGPDSRPFNVAWASSLIDQAAKYPALATKVFVKQLGARPYWHRGRELELADRAGGEPREWPDALRVRQFYGEERP